MNNRRSHHLGFTLFDLMVTITIIVVMAAVVLPNLKEDAMLRLIAASRLLSSDIEMAQIMTISNPDSPIVVRFQPTIGKYWLAEAADPDTPIKRPGATGNYIVEFGKSNARSASGVWMGLTDIDTDTLIFNPQGGLNDLTVVPVIELYHGSRWIELTLSTTTGTITETTGTG